MRSSSKLEDSYYQPFAGVYSTYMIPHTENEDQELRLLSKAIKSVYASVYYAAARGYITSTGNVLSEEKMAIVLQEVCGEQEGNYFFPVISGVARSVNFYPVGKEKPEDGIVKVAYGLGKVVVDGEQVLRFSPKYPKNVLQTSTVDLAMRETQQSMLALSLNPERFKTSIDDAVNLERIPLTAERQTDLLPGVVITQLDIGTPSTVRIIILVIDEVLTCDRRVPVDIRTYAEEMIEVITEPEFRRTGVTVCIEVGYALPREEIRAVAVVIMVKTDAGAVRRSGEHNI